MDAPTWVFVVFLLSFLVVPVYCLVTGKKYYQGMSILFSMVVLVISLVLDWVVRALF